MSHICDISALRVNDERMDEIPYSRSEYTDTPNDDSVHLLIQEQQAILHLILEKQDLMYENQEEFRRKINTLEGQIKKIENDYSSSSSNSSTPKRRRVTRDLSV